MSEQLNLLADDGRMAEISLETLYGLETSPKAMIDFVAHFCVDDEGAYMPHDQAVKVVTKGRSLSDLEGIIEQLREVMELGAVPKA